MHRFFRFLPFVLLALAAAAPAQAQNQQELYTVSGIRVDASGASSTEAFNAGISQGRPRAFQILFRRLTRQQDWNRQPALDAAALLRISRGFDIANERRSTTRYVADVTYRFNPDAVARILRSSGIAFAQGAVRRILVVPMSPGVGRGPWASALANPAFRDSMVPFTVSGAEDDEALAGLNFETAGWNELSAVAARNGVAEVALVQAAYSNGRMMVNIRRVAAGGAPARTSLEVPVQGTMGAVYPVAAQAAVRAVEDLWKTRSVVDYSQRGRLVADVRITSLAQFGGLQAQVGALNTVQSVQVTAMHLGYARLAIAYVGGADQLREQLGGAGVILTQRGGQWTLVWAGG